MGKDNKNSGRSRKELIAAGINPDRDKGIFPTDFQRAVTQAYLHMDWKKIDLYHPDTGINLRVAALRVLYSYSDLPEDVMSFLYFLTH